MEKIKVIEYIGNFGDGGAETLIKDYVRLIDRNRFDPVIVVVRGGDVSANRQIITENNIPIIDIFPHWNFLVRIWKKLFGWWYVPHKLRQIIRNENAKVLHMHLVVLKDVPRIGKVLKNLRLFFTCHNMPEVVFRKEMYVEQKAAEHLVHNENMRLIALHQEMLQKLNKMFRVDNTVVMWNGIDTQRFTDVSITSSMERQKLGIPRDGFVIGHVGRFSEQKNHDFLVDVFIEVAKTRPNAFLLMVGAGNSSQVEKKLNDCGFGERYMILSHRTDVNEIMRAMDVFVFPSIFEGLPVSLVEAQFSGLRCITSDAVTKEAVCTDKVIMLPLGDPSLWKDAVLDEDIKGTSYNDLRLFDMKEVMHRLEKLYLGELR